MYKVQFSAGPGIDNVDVNYMLCQAGDIHLYAETIWPVGTNEDYGYFTLKEVIIEEYRELGGNPKDLEFWYDYCESRLSEDALESRDVTVDCYKEDD